MASATRGEKLKASLFFILIFTFLYTLIFFISSLFIMSWSWGATQNLFQKIFIFILKNPLDPQKGLIVILINGFIWSLLVLLMYNLITKINFKKI